MLSFVMAGRELVEPLELPDAFCRVIHKRPSMDVKLYSDGSGGLTKVMPWPTAEEAVTAVAQEMAITEALLDKLRGGDLSTYVLNPVNGAYMRVHRLYWIQEEQQAIYRLRSVPDATGWEAAMEGQPILVDAAHLSRWNSEADAARARLSPPSPVAQAAPHKFRPETKQQEILRKFLGFVDEAGELNSRATKLLFADYERYCERHRTQQRAQQKSSPQPVKWTAFKKWLRFYRQGHWPQK